MNMLWEYNGYYSDTFAIHYNKYHSHHCCARIGQVYQQCSWCYV